MKPDQRFLNQPKTFWAFVRVIGQECGYTKRKTKTKPNRINVPTRKAVESKLSKIGIDPRSLDERLPSGEVIWDKLVQYFTYRADVLHNHVEPNLMDVDEAKKVFTSLRKKLKPNCPLPMNKQKKEKKNYAFFTCIINMLIENGLSGEACDYDPRALVTITSDGLPVRTFARRMDGAFPSVINPKAVWEIKEYYYTTTFGSRVADGVYETLLDGMEIEELASTDEREILHYLMIDAHFTWWECGKSYLCRLVDMLHMGYVDEVIVGKEVLTKLPELVPSWR